MSATGRRGAGGVGVMACNGIYGEAQPERGIFFRLKVYERECIFLVYERVGNVSFLSVKRPKSAYRCILWP